MHEIDEHIFLLIINIFAKIESGKGDLQIQHVAQSNAGIAGMAASTFGRYSYHRSNTGAQVENNQQSGLGKSVSLNWKFEIANDKWALVIVYISKWVGAQSKVKYRIYLTNFNRILNGIYWTITNFLLSLLASSLTRWEMSLVEITMARSRLVILFDRFYETSNKKRWYILYRIERVYLYSTICLLYFSICSRYI